MEYMKHESIVQPMGQWLLGTPFGQYGVWMQATPTARWMDTSGILRLDVGLLVDAPSRDGDGIREPSAIEYRRQRVGFVPLGASKRRKAFTNTREVFFDEDSVEPLDFVAAFDGEALIGFGRMRPRYRGPDERFGYIFGVGELILSFE